MPPSWHHHAEHPTDAKGFFKNASGDDLSVARMSLMIDLIGSRQLGQGIFGMVWDVLSKPLVAFFWRRARRPISWGLFRLAVALRP